jgi:hypothetical protein
MNRTSAARSRGSRSPGSPNFFPDPDLSGGDWCRHTETTTQTRRAESPFREPPLTDQDRLPLVPHLRKWDRRHSTAHSENIFTCSAPPAAAIRPHDPRSSISRLISAATARAEELGHLCGRPRTSTVAGMPLDLSRRGFGYRDGLGQNEVAHRERAGAAGVGRRVGSCARPDAARAAASSRWVQN